MSNLTTTDWTDEKIALLKKSYAADLTELQFDIFMELCKVQRLNPFTKDIYGMVIKGKLVVVTSINGLTKVAERTGKYAGMDDVCLARDENGKIEAATATCYKMLEGQRCGFTATVYMKEYNTGKNNWSHMPVTMISKVARAHALRLGFPEAANLYEASEADAMGHDFSTSERSREWTNHLKEVNKPNAPDFVEIPGISDEGETK